MWKKLELGWYQSCLLKVSGFEGSSAFWSKCRAQSIKMAQSIKI